MDYDPSRRLGYCVRFCCRLVGVDPEILQRCPPRDQSSVTTIGSLMLLVLVWQVFAFTLTGHVMLDEATRIRPELVALAVLLATIVLLVDSYTVMRSSWFVAGLGQLKRGGLKLPGYTGGQIKNGLQYLFRFSFGGVLAELAAIGMLLVCFATEITRVQRLDAIAANAPLREQVTEAFNADSGRRVQQIDLVQNRLTEAQKDLGSYRRDVLQAPNEDPELKPATDRARRADAARVEAERRLSRSASQDSPERRQAQQQVAARRADAVAAQARLEKVRERSQTAIAQRTGAVQGRLDETLAAEQRFQEQIDTLQREHDTRIASRETSIRAAMEQDPSYRPADRGLLARAKVLARLMDDPWVFTLAMLLHAGFFGIELGAIMCKVLASVPSTYAVILASEEYGFEVETVNRLVRRIHGEPGPELPGETEPVPDPHDPLEGDDAVVDPPAPANDAEEPTSVETAESRLEEGARLARAQAETRADAKKKRSGPSPGAEIGSLASDILDGPVKRGRGRPPGAKNQKKPANDDQPKQDGEEVA